ncbi:MAG: hypothetical protein AAF449_17060 [Myxococcota bacterium]
MARRKRKKKGEPDIEELTAPDQFETVGATGVGWLEKNFIFVLIGAAAILGAVLLAEFIGSSQARSNSQMTAALNEAIESFSSAVDMRTVLTSTASEEIKNGYRESQKKLADFRSKYADEKAAALAGLYEAELWRRLDEPEKAVPLYEKYISTLGSSGEMAFMAHEGAGYAYEKLGQLDKALGQFEKMGQFDFAKAYALKHQGRVLEAKKDRERALAVYRELSSLDVTSPLKTFADERLRMLE